MGDQPTPAADVMYGPPAAPPPPPRVPAVERDADAMYSGPVAQQTREPPQTTPELKIVAKAAGSQTASERMYGEAPPPPPEAAPTSEREQQRDGPSQEGNEGEAQPAEIQLLQLSDKIALRAPEGWTQWDEGALSKLAPIADKYGLDTEGAQALLDLHVQGLAEEGAQAQHALYEQLNGQREEMVAGWQRDYVRDPDIKAYGVNQAKTVARSMMEAFFEPSFRDVLRQTGLNSHPGLTKTLLHLQDVMNGARTRAAGYEPKPSFRARWKERS